jgi:hypothetical protein
VKLGGPKLAQAREAAAASIRALADPHAANVLPIIREIQRAGSTSLHQIADALNARGMTTRWAVVCEVSEQRAGASSLATIKLEDPASPTTTRSPESRPC